MSFLGFLAPIFGVVMEWIYRLIPNYGWTLIVFTLLTKILMFPLSLKQQKSTARMAAYNPMIQDIQKKWANDKQRQQEELMKLQEETGMSMTAGCWPMLLNMLILFGIIQVVYRPMQYILRVPSDLITQAVEYANSSLGMSLVATDYRVQNTIINIVKETPNAFASIFSAEQIANISAFNFQFFGLDLSQVPHVGFDSTVFTADNLMLMVIPILSGVTMILSQMIVTKMSGQDMQGQNQMKVMMWVMSLMFVYIGFTIPVGFSLYYTVSNVLVLGQSIVLKKIYDPEEMKRQVQEEIAAKRAEKKKKKQVKVVTADGAEEVKEVSEAELARIRLARARELEAERYKDE